MDVAAVCGDADGWDTSYIACLVRSAREMWPRKHTDKRAFFGLPSDLTNIVGSCFTAGSGWEERNWYSFGRAKGGVDVPARGDSW